MMRIKHAQSITVYWDVHDFGIFEWKVVEIYIYILIKFSGW